MMATGDRSTAALAMIASVIIAATPSGSMATRKIQQGTLIHLSDGDVQGSQNGKTRQFLGIPFAAPPIGALRWRPPAAVTPWQGVLQADTFSRPCPQLASIQGRASDNEDCLYLNVWTPDPAPAKPRPVMVWFHGGGNEQGSAGDAVPFPGVPGLFYDGQVLAQERDVVVVTINYRLNAFGFFAHSALAAEDPSYPYAGNQGLLDQRAALEWVRANVIAFGGNPKKVTIFGESAGSEDVCFHVVSPGSHGLFRRGISESGGCTTRQPTAAEGAATAEAFAAAVGCGGAADELGCLRQLPASTLLAHQPADGLGPVVDGGFLPDQPRTFFDTGHYARVPYLLGSNTDEGTLFFLGVPPVTTEAEYQAALQAQYGPLADQVAAVYPAADFATPQDALVRAFGDSILVCSTYDTARRAAAGGARTYLYNFAREYPDSRAAGGRPARVPRLRDRLRLRLDHSADSRRCRAGRDDARLLDAFRTQRQSQPARDIYVAALHPLGRPAHRPGRRPRRADGVPPPRVRVLVERLRRPVRGRLTERGVRPVTGLARP